MQRVWQSRKQTGSNAANANFTSIILENNIFYLFKNFVRKKSLTSLFISVKLSFLMQYSYLLSKQ
jgi:hypothetical protein